MTRLTPPKPAITLFKTGFEDAGDMLDRKKTGAALSELVERIEDPMVIALDGGWGTGKSFFLQAWAGEHLKTAEHKAQTVYYVFLIGQVKRSQETNRLLRPCTKLVPDWYLDRSRGALIDHPQYTSFEANIFQFHRELTIPLRRHHR